MKHHCHNCRQISCADCCNNYIILEDLDYFFTMKVCGSCYESRQSSIDMQLMFLRTSSEVSRFLPSTQEPAKKRSELAFELLNALKFATVAIVKSNITQTCELFKGRALISLHLSLTTSMYNSISKVPLRIEKVFL